MTKFQLSKSNINQIKEILNKPDGVITFPTDTVWGVGCLVEHKSAVERIYNLKGRSKDKPLILLGNKLECLKPYINNIPDAGQKIIEKYLPGGVTVVLPKSDKTPSYITSGFDTVGIRIPDHPPFLEMLELCVENHVLATTSANLSGAGSNINKTQVIVNIGDDIDYIFDDYGYLPNGTDSTVVLVNQDNTIKILRQGAVTLEL